MNRRGYKHALTKLRRLREDRVRYEIAYLLIEKTVIAAARNDLYLIGAYHVVECVCVYAGSIDHILR